MSKNFFRLALSAMLLALSFPANAQQPKKIPRIVYLSAFLRFRKRGSLRGIPAGFA